MLNNESIAQVKKSSFSSSFCKPLYKSYCFSRIPATVRHLLTGKKGDTLPKDCFGKMTKPYDMVVLFLIDGFGWRFFEKYADKYPFLKRIVEEGIASKITSQFPSTTAAHVTSLNTGLEVGQTGVYEWFYYEPKVDRMIAPLLYSFAGDKTIGTLEKANVSPKEIYPSSTIYQEFKKEGIDSYILQDQSIVNSVYSKAMCQGAHPISFMQFEQGLTSVAEEAFTPNGAPSYFCVYFADIDSMGHRHGVDSKKFEEAIDHCMQSLEKFFWQKIQKSKKRIACLVTADHGMVEVNPKKTFYLNKEMPSIVNNLERNKKKELLVPAGSCRDFFLHVKKEKVQETLELLQKKLKGIAEVYLTEDLISQGFFGSKAPSKLFLNRVGNMVILSYEKEAVWWYEKNRFEQHFYGAHGGLTRGEMESIFLFIEK